MAPRVARVGPPGKRLLLHSGLDERSAMAAQAPPGEERDSGKRTMGSGLKDLDLTGSQRQPKRYRCKSYTPPAGEESFHLEEDDGVGVPGTDLNGLDVSGEN